METNLILELHRQRGIFPQGLPRIILTLANAATRVAIPGAGLLNDPSLSPQIEDFTLARGTFAIQDVEFRLSERQPCS